MAITMTNKRMFRNAGVITLIKQLADGRDSTDTDDIFTSDGGIVDSITMSFNKSTSTMNDGNSMYPAGTYTESISATVVPTLNTIDPKLWCFLTGASIVTSASAPFYRSGMDFTITQQGTDPTYTYEVDLGGALAAGTPVLVRLASTGVDFAVTTESTIPTNGFKVDYDTGVLTFAAADVGKAVYVSCYYVAPDVVSYELPANPPNTVFKMIISGENYDVKETDKKWDNYIVDSVRVSGDIPLPARSKTHGNWAPTFNLEKPRPGAKAVSWQNADPIV